MEFLQDFGVFIATYGTEILKWLGIGAGTTLGGISIWKLANIIIKIIKLRIEKKYTEKQNELTEKLLNAYDKLSNKLVEEVKNKVTEQFTLTFNAIEEKKAQKKQEIYERIFNGKQKVQELETKVETEIAKIEPIVEEVKQEINEIENVANTEQIAVEKPKKDIDLL